MKPTAAKFLGPLTEPFMDWCSPLGELFNIVVLTLVCLGLLLACKALVEPLHWLQRFSRAVGQRHDAAPKKPD